MGKKVAVLIRDRDRQYEGLRCSLGLLLEEHRVGMFVLRHEIALSEEYLENLGFIDETGGARFSDNTANVSQHGFRELEPDALARMLHSYDLVIPF